MAAIDWSKIQGPSTNQTGGRINWNQVQQAQARIAQLPPPQPVQAPQPSLWDNIKNAGSAVVNGASDVLSNTVPRGIVGNLQDFVNSAANSAASVPIAGAQALTNGVAQAGQWAANHGILSPQTAQTLNDYANLQNQYYNQMHQNYERTTPTDAGSALGALAGQLPYGIALSAPSEIVGNAAQSGVHAAADALSVPASVAQKASNAVGAVVRPAVMGAAIGAGTPAYNAQSTASVFPEMLTNAETGAALGAATDKLLHGGADATIQPVKNALNPGQVVAQRIVDLTGKSPEDLASALDNRPNFVPGVQHTTPNVLINDPYIGSAAAPLIDVQKRLMNEPGVRDQFTQQDAANNAARWDYLNAQKVDPQTLADLVQARTNATQPLYNSVQNTPVYSEELNNLLNSPMGQSAQKTAEQYRLNMAATNDPNTPPPLVASVDENGVPTAYNVGGVHNVYRALRDNLQLPASAPNAYTGAMRDAGTTLSTNLRDALSGLSNQWGEAQQLYSQLSPAISSQTTLANLLDQLGAKSSSSVGGVPFISSARANLPLDKASQGNLPSFGDHPAQYYPLSPDVQTAVDNVRNDLNYNNGVNNPSFAIRGSPTQFNMASTDWLQRLMLNNNAQPSNIGAAGASLGAVGASAILPHTPILPEIVGGALGGGVSLLSRPISAGLKDAWQQAIANPDYLRQNLADLLSQPQSPQNLGWIVNPSDATQPNQNQ